MNARPHSFSLVAVTAALLVAIAAALSSQTPQAPALSLLSKDGRIIGRGTGLGAEAMQDTNVALRELEAWVAARVKK